MSFELPEYDVLSEPELRTAAGDIGVEYAKTGSAIVWLAECVRKIAAHLSDMDDDVDALWAVSVGDVMSPADFSPDDMPKAFHQSKPV